MDDRYINMNFNFMPSLEHMAVVRTAVMLWNHEDNKLVLMKDILSNEVCSLVLSNDLKKTRSVWLEVENKIIKKVPKLLLPKSLENKLLNVIKPIGQEILKWSVLHETVLKADRKCIRQSLNKLCWTAQGTVDRMKTAEILIHDKNFEISNRYKLACYYCLEYDIPILWNKMSEASQKFFHCEDPNFISQHDIVKFWTYSIKGEVAKVKDMIIKRFFPPDHVIYVLPEFHDEPYYRYMFETAADTSKSATEYFFKKLTCSQKDELLVSTAVSAAEMLTSTSPYMAPCKLNGEALVYLLSQMNNSMRTKVFKSDSVLKCLLEWPWQNFFKEVANCMSESFPVSLDVLTRIADKVIDGYRDYNYQMLFRDIWQLKQSDNLAIKLAIDESSYRSLLLKLILADDKQNVELISNDITQSQREKIIFSLAGMKTCYILISNDKWDSLKFFIQKCIPCKSKIGRFKLVFKHCILTEQAIRQKKEGDKWNKFFKFVDDLAQEMNKKRSKGEGDCSPAKRLSRV